MSMLPRALRALLSFLSAPGTDGPCPVGHLAWPPSGVPSDELPG